jgi:hypothetical protein
MEITMNRNSLQLLAAAAACALSIAHASPSPWLGENVPFDAAADEPQSTFEANYPANESDLIAGDDGSYVFSEANFPAMATSADEDSAAIIVARFDPQETP